MGTLNLDLIMGIPRIIEFIVYFICAIVIYKKRDYYLNKIYALSLFGWCIYVICDLLIFPIGHIEPIAFPIADSPGFFYPLIANILREFQVAGALIIAFGYPYASIIIRYGAARAKKRKNILIFIGAAIPIAIITMLNDSIRKNIYVSPQLVSTHYTPLGILIFAVQLILYFFAIYQHLKVYRGIEKDKPRRRKILYFILGSLFIAAGVLYFIIIGKLISGQEYQIITGPIGHTIWIFSPICIYYGLK
ncbi:MAG: hypothetical protein EU549_02010 [Promethearchaeota archaeon]|nr:MAG: hypothetical protein EU549_02010 [Candidatus Lokiarchaeota archaeon]